MGQKVTVSNICLSIYRDGSNQRRPYFEALKRHGGDEGCAGTPNARSTGACGMGRARRAAQECGDDDGAGKKGENRNQTSMKGLFV
jgi:hypothetical protein